MAFPSPRWVSGVAGCARQKAVDVVGGRGIILAWLAPPSSSPHPPQDPHLGGALTCDGALAGVASGQGPDAVRRVGDLIPTILDEDGVPTSHVWDIRHSVGAILVVTDGGFLGLALRILTTAQPRKGGKHFKLRSGNCSSHSKPRSLPQSCYGHENLTGICMSENPLEPSMAQEGQLPPRAFLAVT